PRNLNPPGSRRVVVDRERFFRKQNDGWCHAILAVMYVYDVASIRLYILFLSAFKEALHLQSNLANTLQLGVPLQLPWIFSSPGINGDLKELRRPHPPQKAVRINHDTGHDVTIGGLQRLLRHPNLRLQVGVRMLSSR